MEMVHRWKKVERFLRSPLATVISSGCIVLFCISVGVGGFFIAGNLYYSGQTNRFHLIDPGQPIATVTLPSLADTPATSSASLAGPQGKIVYVCQIFRSQDSDQICIINADGSGQRRLTTDDNARYFYPSFAPDGQSVLFSSNVDGNFEIYEFILATGQQIQLGGIAGVAPEVSPDNLHLAYTRSDGVHTDTIWVADRNGLNPREVYRDGWDPTWSPDGRSLLFATNSNGKSQLAAIHLDGSGLRLITDLPDLRGRSDWSADGLHIVTYSGKPWQRELYIMDVDGSNLRQVSPNGGNSQGPSFSPDGQWIVFTAYFDHYQDINGCEIYIMRIDGSSLRRMTDNQYCDWQPRWGP